MLPIRKKHPTHFLLLGGNVLSSALAHLRLKLLDLTGRNRLAAKDHVTALLAGVNTEVGRIGYVAVTRARNLLWLGVPANALAELRPALLAHEFQEIGAAVVTPT